MSSTTSLASSTLDSEDIAPSSDSNSDIDVDGDIGSDSSGSSHSSTKAIGNGSCGTCLWAQHIRVPVDVDDSVCE